MCGSRGSRSIFSVFQSALVAPRGMREVRTYTYTNIQIYIYRRARQAVAKTVDGGPVKEEGGACLSVFDRFGNLFRGLGAFAGVFSTRGMHPVARFFILGFSLKT